MPRAPFGPWPQPQDYATTPPLEFLTYERDLYRHRANFCGLYYVDAPFVPGANDRNPGTIMSCLLDNYSAGFQQRYLKDYAQAGYTHLQRSLGHALGYGHSLTDFIELSKRAKEEFGLWNDVWFIANEFPGFALNQDWSFWGPKLLPIIDQLLKAGIIDTACVAWQLDQINGGAPGNATISIIAGIADALPPSVPLYTHWVNEALAWWKVVGRRPDGSDIGEVWTDRYQGSVEIANRFDWWRAMRFYLTGGHHQGNTTMARTQSKLYQDKMRDTINPFNGDTSKGNMMQSVRSGTSTNFKLTVYESTAQDQFDGNCTEALGDQIGYILVCAGANGYGNGARRPDGSAF